MKYIIGKHRGSGDEKTQKETKPLEIPAIITEVIYKLVKKFLRVLMICLSRDCKLSDRGT